MTRHKPFTKTEMKLLVHNKIKTRGLSYDEACEELNMEIEEIIKNSSLKHKKEVKEKNPKKDDFKKHFQKLTDGK